MEKYIKSYRSYHMNLNNGGSVTVVLEKSVTYYPNISAEFGIYDYYPSTKEEFEKAFNETIEFLKSKI